MKYKFKNFDKYTKLAIIIILVGILIRFALAIIYHVSGDACWHLSVGRFIAINGKIPLFEGLGRNEPFWAPPLFHFMTAFVYNIFSFFSNNVANFSIKFISPFFGSLTLIFSYLIFKKFFNRKISFYAILFLTFIPIHMDYSVFGYVEAALTFFVVLSVYFALENRVLLSSIAAGLSILTKYNGLFILPLLVYIFYYKNKGNNKVILKKTLQITLIPLLIALPWFVRNYALLGNPIWPFLNFAFNSFEKAAYSGFDVSRLTSTNLFIFTFLGFFGVPDGNPQSIFFIKFPFLSSLFIVWLVSTIIFIVPAIFGFKFKKIIRNILLLWVLSYIFLLLLYVSNVGFSVSRMLLPAIPALAILWGKGFTNLNLKFKKFGKVLKILIVLIIAGFVFTEFLKLSIAANLWNFYNEDFDWVKSNTNDNSILLSGGQCLPFNMERQTLFPEDGNLEKTNYAFVNQNFNLDNGVVMENNLLDQVETEGKVVYSNERTGTKIYKIK